MRYTVFQLFSVHHLFLKQQSDGIGGNAFFILDLILFVVALMPIWSGSNFLTVARRSRIVEICGFNFGRSLPRNQYFPPASLYPELAGVLYPIAPDYLPSPLRLCRGK